MHFDERSKVGLGSAHREPGKTRTRRTMSFELWSRRVAALHLLRLLIRAWGVPTRRSVDSGRLLVLSIRWKRCCCDSCRRSSALTCPWPCHRLCHRFCRLAWWHGPASGGTYFAPLPQPLDGPAMGGLLVLARALAHVAFVVVPLVVAIQRLVDVVVGWFLPRASGRGLAVFCPSNLVHHLASSLPFPLRVVEQVIVDVNVGHVLPDFDVSIGWPPSLRSFRCLLARRRRLCSSRSGVALE